jgi:hypothetical protein
MSRNLLVDSAYSAFVRSLSEPLMPAARRLAHTLGLAPPLVPWSEVFGHEVTLAAPALFAEGMPNGSPQKTRDAVLAHMLAVIEAFGTDRIEDKQVRPSPELEAVLSEARRHRNLATARVYDDPHAVDTDFGTADRVTMAGIRRERVILASGAAADFHTYERISLAKQAVGFPASLALARAAGWGARRRALLAATLASIWLGLQMSDDVVDWEDDLDRGGAWAIALMRDVRARQPRGDRVTETPIHVPLYRSGVLARMMSRSAWHFRAAARRARLLGAVRLSAWAGAQAERVGAMALAEAAHGGYAVRAHALAAWAREVLA